VGKVYTFIKTFKKTLKMLAFVHIEFKWKPKQFWDEMYILFPGNKYLISFLW